MLLKFTEITVLASSADTASKVFVLQAVGAVPHLPPTGRIRQHAATQPHLNPVELLAEEVQPLGQPG